MRGPFGAPKFKLRHYQAASRGWAATQAVHPEIAWREITNMRHRLIRGYEDVDLGKVWSTVTDDLDPLVAALLRLIPPEDES